MDATMPRMTGPTAFQAIRALDPEAKAILCSGFGDERGWRAAGEAGFLGHLKKPFLLRELEESVRRALGES
jgi:DNA-binding NtrC family response regulator